MSVRIRKTLYLLLALLLLIPTQVFAMSKNSSPGSSQKAEPELKKLQNAILDSVDKFKSITDPKAAERKPLNLQDVKLTKSFYINSRTVSLSKKNLKNLEKQFDQKTGTATLPMANGTQQPLV